MININKQLDEVISKQLKDITPILEQIEEGSQKEFIKNALSEIQKNRTLDINSFIENFSKIKGEKVDIESLREMAKKNQYGS
tara:strand:+ start:14398 stop:14643 length:246 start_codon:yes stop_codon:yes gene_type:complete